LPIITSDVGGTREMIRHQQNGWLVKPDDPHALATQILSAMQDAHVRRQLGRNARKDTLARFSPQNCLAMYRDLYTRLAPAPETVIPSTEEAALCAG
jgi:glycosyltransferase involved in cell wall biosynthesis